MQIISLKESNVRPLQYGLAGIWVLLAVLVLCTGGLQYWEALSQGSLWLSTLLVAGCVLMGLVFLGRLPNGGKDFLDPGFMFFALVGLSVLPVAILTIAGIQITQKIWVTETSSVLARVLLMHGVLLLFFFFSYVVFARKRLPNFNSNTSTLLPDVYWYCAAVLLWLFQIGINAVSSIPFPIHFVIEGAQEIATIIACGVFLARMPNRHIARGMLILVAGAYYVLANTLAAGNGGHFVNKSSAFVLAIGAAAYADAVRWHGTLFSWRFMALAVIGALLALEGANILEDVYLGGSMPSPSEWARRTALALEPLVVENAGRVITWIDQGTEPLHYGRNYVELLGDLFPFSRNSESLADWYIWKTNAEQARVGARYAFSAVAEGYLNMRAPGVAVHGIVLGGIAALMQRLKFSRLWGGAGIVLYAVSLRMTYYFYRTCAFEVVKRIQYIVIHVAVLIFVLYVLRNATQMDRPQES